jgi:hypothetical protein
MSFESCQLVPLDLSWKGGLTGGLTAVKVEPGGDDRRLSNSSDFTDRSPSRSPCSSTDLPCREGGGGPRKRYLSKHFTSVKDEYPSSSSPTIRGVDGKVVAQWMFQGEGLGRFSPLQVHPGHPTPSPTLLHPSPTQLHPSPTLLHPPNPAHLTGQRTHVFTTTHSPNSSGSHPPSPADSGVSDVEPSSSCTLSDEDTKSRVKSEDISSQIHPGLLRHLYQPYTPPSG